MPKLQDDPVVKDFVAKAVAKQLKAERKRVQTILKDTAKAATAIEDKGIRRTVKDMLANVKESVAAADTAEA